MDNVKIIRLQSGEDLIAEVQEDVNGYFVLINPFVIFTKRNGDVKTSVFLAPWLPIDIIEENMANVFMSDIMTTMIPTSELVSYYEKMLLEIEFEDYDAEMSSDSDSDYADNIDDYIDEPIEVKSNKTIH